MKSIASALVCLSLVGYEQRVQARRVQAASADAENEPLKAFSKMLSELRSAGAFNPRGLAAHAVPRHQHLSHRAPATGMGDAVDAKSLAAALGFDYDEDKASLDRMIALGVAEDIIKTSEFLSTQEPIDVEEEEEVKEEPSILDDMLPKAVSYSSLLTPEAKEHAEPEPKAAPEPEAAAPPAAKKAAPKAAAAEKEAKPKVKKNKPSPTGIFAPAVLATKRMMGDKALNKLRADIIKKHSKVMAKFVDTSESPFGQLVLSRMFEAADKDNSGALDKEEIKDALYALGFYFVKDTDVDKIMKKADIDKNEVIDFEEFVKEAPKVLRTNLVNLARENGHDLGFLA